jgi:predicted dehydrogenase
MKKKKSPLKVGLIGLQHLHPSFYLSLFRSVRETRPVAVAEPDRKLRDRFCQVHRIRGYPSWEQMLQEENLDLAALFLPHADFPAIATGCARQGLHLLVDKPMAATAQGGQRIVKAARQYNVKLTVPYYWRLHPVAQKIKKIVQDGVIGSVAHADTCFWAQGPARYIKGNSGWMVKKSRSGGGPLHNIGVHWIDLLCYILEDQVQRVSGHTINLFPSYDIEGIAQGLLCFRKGTLASIRTGYCLPQNAAGWARQSFSLVGTRGMLSWIPDCKPEKDLLIVSTDNPRYPRFRNFRQLFSLKGNLHRMGRVFIRDFARCIRDDKEPFITGADGVAVLKTVQAAYQAAGRGSWVTVKN